MTLRRVGRYLAPYWLPFTGTLALVFVVSGLELAKPWPLKVVIDHVLSGVPWPWALGADWSPQARLLAACVVLVGVYGLLGVVMLVQNYVTIRIGQAMVNDLRRDLYAHLQRLSLGFHSRRHVGDLLYRVTSDTYGIQGLVMNGVFPVLSALVLLAGMFVIMARLDPFLTLLALAVCPILFAVIAVLDRPISAAAATARERESVVYSLVQRTMSAIRVVQAFTTEPQEQRRFLNASRASLAASLRLYTLQTAFGGAVGLILAAGTALLVWVGARHVMAGTLSVGELVVFTAYLASLYVPLNNIVQTWALVQSARAGVRRVFEILDVERDLPEGSRVLTATSARGDIAWEGVAFGYVPGVPVLRRVDLRVPGGATVAVVGPTGAGKSTLLSLLPRFYDPAAGRVTIGGVDVREFTIESLRSQIAMVLQPPLVFPGTVRDNIAYGRPGAGDAAIVDAARRAAAHDFVSRLPQGYDTLIGEQGTTISEGEKQRLTIARALLRDAPILILDEPTASVDAETEVLIIEGLRRLAAGRTTLVIAHRLSTVRQADLVVVVRDGVIVEQGSFDALLRHRGVFTALYQTQLAHVEPSGAGVP